jgi:peroxiredoxin
MQARRPDARRDHPRRPLDFMPATREPYDLVLAPETLEDPVTAPLRALLDSRRIASAASQSSASARARGPRVVECVPSVVAATAPDAMPAAPDFSLPSVDGSPLELAELRARGPAVLVFVSEECPTCALALRRLAPLAGALRAAGVTLAAIFEDPPEVAARSARSAGFVGTVLAEPVPYEVSRAYGLEALPTTVLVDRAGEVIGRSVGWDAEALQDLLNAARRQADGGAPPVAVTRAAPLVKPGCAAKNTYDAAALALLDARGDEIEEMFVREWTDGLPVVPPTRERVEAMLGGRDPGRTLGAVPPSLGEATLERVAACAVLAGCRPDYFPVVLTAVEAALDPAFNVGGQAVTTQAAGQLVVVNGPIRHALGFNAGMGALGPGSRANLTVGRALRLVVTLTGGARPGRLDRATLGHPGKLGFCLAEDEEGSPWPPLHVERGFATESSVVTLIACDAPLSISDHRSTTADELAWVLGWAAATTWSPNWWPLGATSVYIVCPEHRSLFASAGWSKERVRNAMFDAVTRRAHELRRGETTPAVAAADPEAVINKWTGPEEIVLIAAGGEAGRYSALLGPCLGMEAAVMSREIVE